MFLIGTVKDSYIVNTIIEQMSNGSRKVYGISFDENGIATRLYDSKGLIFEPSSTSVAGRDDFINIDNGHSPFHIRECLTTYNSSTCKQEVVAYEGDENYAANRENADYNVMIEFPKFYYKRPSKYEWLVSSYPLNGFAASPWHYRDGYMHEYAYVGKYMTNSGFMSRPEQVGLVGSTAVKLRNGFRQQGMQIMSYSGWASINMLMLVKYGTLNIQKLIGYGWSYGSNKANTGGADAVLGKDGYAATNKMDNGQIVAMGIEDYWGNCWKFAEGCFRSGNMAYLNTEIEKIQANPTVDMHPNYFEFPLNPDNNFTGFGWIDDFYYHPQFPWAFFPETTTHTTKPNYPTDPERKISEGYWHSVSTAPAMCIVGGYWKYGYACGPFAMSLGMLSTFPLVNITAHSFFLSDKISI